MDKKELRSSHRKLRDAMTAKEVKAYSKKIEKRIIESALFEKSTHIYLYYPLGNEVSLLEVAKYCMAQGKNIAFPKIIDGNMEFIEVHTLMEFAEGYFHVMEPIGSHVVCWEDALVLTPGVVFDGQGERIGYGKGFYDSYFKKHPDMRRMGVAYQNQIAAYIPKEVQDVAMEFLVTEDGCWNVPKELMKVQEV